jgi:hypothetical protein
LSPAVALELGCLQTNGACLLHLQGLQQLRSLTLEGNITLNDTSWGFLARLHLPGVTQLSLTGCRFIATPESASSAGTAPAATNSKAAAEQALAHAAAAGAGIDSDSSMDRLAGAIVTAFPSCRGLELGSCATLSYEGLEVLLLALQQLRVLRLLGLLNFKLAESRSAAAGSSHKGKVSKKVSHFIQQVRDVLSRNGSEQQLQPYFSRLAERRRALQQQQQSAAAEHVGSSAAAVAAAAAEGRHSYELQLQYLEVCDAASHASAVPQSALLSAQQQSSSSRSGVGLPALACLLGAGQGLLQQMRCRSLVFVNVGGSMVPLVDENHHYQVVCSSSGPMPMGLAPF